MTRLQIRFSRNWSTTLYIFFAWIFVYFEEVVIGYELYKAHLIFLSVMVHSTYYTNFSAAERNRFLKYYQAICKHQLKRLFVIARESSIQLVFQNAILIYDFFHQPVTELYYQDKSYPTAYWRFMIFIRTISIFISAFATLLPIIEDYKMKCYKKFNEAPTPIQIFVNALKVLAHIALSTGLVYLERLENTIFQ